LLAAPTTHPKQAKRRLVAFSLVNATLKKKYLHKATQEKQAKD